VCTIQAAASRRFPSICRRRLCRLVVLLAVVVVVAVVGDEFIVCDVDCECSECDAEAGERALEAVAGAEGTRVSPGLAVSASVSCYFWSCSRYYRVQTYALAQGSLAGWPAAAANF
jgi:hypothetical protein